MTNLSLFLVVMLASSLSLCRGDGCPEICPSVWQPLCAGVGGVETRTFSNMCQMVVHNCNQEAALVKIKDGVCDKDIQT